MRVTVAMIAQLVQGDIEGDPQIEIQGPAPIEAGTLAPFLFWLTRSTNPLPIPQRPSALLVDRQFQLQQPISATLIRVDNVRPRRRLPPQRNLTKARRAVAPWPTRPLSMIQRHLKGTGVSIGRFSVVEAGAEIGDGTIIHDQVSIGKGADRPELRAVSGVSGSMPTARSVRMHDP